ncbi:ABC transporter ATP-binding protein [Phragmitibacter flavus]|uniref:ABC transporter ATP-binding protein n=1 Tax=Phragmitibacter flavus TaxID=2576071 RepID=A0A5R8KER0_9BACT|nr:ABC transporter ATP-binding protein [Phragmitibacter flavus]TLD70782.1 ABC transporter ATP-binding protein [Phragmitibacter flavus]
MPILELRNVSKSYGEPGSANAVEILRDANLVIEAGESVAITGPSGCGKSTVLNLLGTLDEPDRGEIVFDGEVIKGGSIVQLSKLRSEKIGFIFQLHHLLPQCTVMENVLLPAQALAEKPDFAVVEKRAKELLSLVGLDQRLKWFPGQLSGGERQRVAVVRALINQPKVILADEPTGALDETNANTLTDLMINMSEKFGISLVLVSHNPDQAQRMKRVLRLHEGKFESVK